jgi:hypothetical protein
MILRTGSQRNRLMSRRVIPNISKGITSRRWQGGLAVTRLAKLLLVF